MPNSSPSRSRLLKVAAIAAVAVTAFIWYRGLEPDGPEAPPHPDDVVGPGGMLLSSTAFAASERIPARHTCDGENLSPALAWSGLPEGTQSLVLIVDDPDAPDPAAPEMTWVHWVLYDIPPETAGLPEGVAPGDLPDGALQGINSWNAPGYGGPCPPIGEHRYFHKLYALSEPLGDWDGPTADQVVDAMRGKVLGSTELIGTYAKQQE
jgi:Raf kinase inhibitor-like YbhB/YbcL family protein